MLASGDAVRFETIERLWMAIAFPIVAISMRRRRAGRGMPIFFYPAPYDCPLLQMPARFYNESIITEEG
jgi:hypothetical protein